MRPWYKSKKVWAAVFTSLAAIASAVAGDVYNMPELGEKLVVALTSIGIALQLALGATDFGKEAKSLEKGDE